MLMHYGVAEEPTGFHLSPRADSVKCTPAIRPFVAAAW